MIAKGPIAILSDGGHDSFASVITAMLSENEYFTYEISRDGKCLVGFVGSRDTEYPAIIRENEVIEALTVFDGFLFERHHGDYADHLLTRSYIDDIADTINGMFTCVQYSGGVLRVLTDPWGSQPLYYAVREGSVIVTSSLLTAKALVGGEELSEEGVSQYLHFGCIISDHTIYKDIFKRRSAELLEFAQDGSSTIRTSRYKYFTPRIEENENPTLYEGIADAFQHAIRTIDAAAQGSTLISISGGFDSRVITAAAQGIRKDYDYVTHYTTPGVDMEIAARVAEMMALKHRMLTLPSEYSYSDNMPMFDDAANRMAPWDNVHVIHAYREYGRMHRYMIDGNHTSIEGRWFLRNMLKTGISKGAFSAKVVSAMTRSSRLGLLRMDCSDRYAALAEELLHDVMPDPAEYPSAGACADMFNVQYLIPNHSNDIVALQNHYIRYVTPYYDRRYVQLVCQARERSRWMQKPQNEILRAYAPALARVPRSYSDIETYAVANPFLLRVPIAAERMYRKAPGVLGRALTAAFSRYRPSIVYDIVIEENALKPGRMGELFDAETLSSIIAHRRLKNNSLHVQLLNILAW